MSPDKCRCDAQRYCTIIVAYLFTELTLVIHDRKVRSTFLRACWCIVKHQVQSTFKRRYFMAYSSSFIAINRSTLKTRLVHENQSKCRCDAQGYWTTIHELCKKILFTEFVWFTIAKFNQLFSIHTYLNIGQTKFYSIINGGCFEQ